ERLENPQPVADIAHRGMKGSGHVPHYLLHELLSLLLVEPGALWHRSFSSMAAAPLIKLTLARRERNRKPWRGAARDCAAGKLGRRGPGLYSRFRNETSEMVGDDS